MNENLKDYIVVLENVISNELCEEILFEYQRSREWKKARTINGVNTSARNVSSINLSEENSLNQNYEKRKKIDDEIFACASKAIGKYNEKFSRCEINQDSGYELLRYTENQFYVEHTDSYIGIPRHVSCSFAINDNYEGGEFGFFGRELTIKAPKGSALMFPSNFMYPHEIMPVTKRIRYSIVTWFT